MHPLSTQFADTIKAQGGATADLQTGQAPSSGTMVSRFGSEHIIEGTPKPEDVDSYISQHKETLSAAGSHLGGWTEAGKTYLDASVNFDNPRQARSFGKQNAQRAVYDIDADKARRLRYEPRMSPAGTLFEGFRKAHATYARAVSESSRREVELNLERSHYAAEERREPPQGKQLKLW